MSACSPAPTPAGKADAGGAARRFLYVVQCDARVDKLDLVERKQVESFNLRDRSGSPPAVAAAPDGRIDGCLVQRAVADAKGETVSLIAPRSARLDSEGLQAFQALSFVLPDWALTAVLPAGRLPEAPRLEIAADGRVRIPSDENWTPVIAADLSGYPGEEAHSGSPILASSDRYKLLSVLSADSNNMDLGLADTVAHTLVRLSDVPTTTLNHVHLAPGGAFVLVEATASADKESQPNGELALFDSTGKRIGRWKDEGPVGGRFVALTPQGDAVYRIEAGYRFVALGRSFGSAKVEKPIPDLADPGLIYSSR